MDLLQFEDLMLYPQSVQQDNEFMVNSTIYYLLFNTLTTRARMLSGTEINALCKDFS